MSKSWRRALGERGTAPPRGHAPGPAGKNAVNAVAVAGEYHAVLPCASRDRGRGQARRSHDRARLGATPAAPYPFSSAPPPGAAHELVGGAATARALPRPRAGIGRGSGTSRSVERALRAGRRSSAARRAWEERTSGAFVRTRRQETVSAAAMAVISLSTLASRLPSGPVFDALVELQAVPAGTFYTAAFSPRSKVDLALKRQE